MTSIEAMLVDQARALQTMFVTLGRMATNETQLAHYTAFMNLALKAQSQSRATIQALVELNTLNKPTLLNRPILLMATSKSITMHPLQTIT